MEGEVSVVGPRAVSAETQQAELRRAVETAARSRAKSTRRVYEIAWRQFADWCAERGLNHLPADGATVAVWLSSLFAAGLKPSTIGVKAAAVAYFHGRSKSAEEKVCPNPCLSVEVGDTLAGIRNSAADLGVRTKQAEPVSVARLTAAVAHIDRATVRGRRDAALLLLGFASALRRSELSALEIGDVEREEKGLIVHVRRSKGDQQGRGQAVGVPYGADPALCPAKALDAWLADLGKAGFTEGPIFREIHRGGAILDKSRTGEPAALNTESINRIVRKRLAMAGVEGTSAHGLRAGFATETLRRGVSLAKVQAHLRHADPKTTMAYYRHRDKLDGPPGEGLL